MGNWSSAIIKSPTKNFAWDQTFCCAVLDSYSYLDLLDQKRGAAGIRSAWKHLGNLLRWVGVTSYWPVMLDRRDGKGAGLVQLSEG